jgi:hypothetical protein
MSSLGRAQGEDREGDSADRALVSRCTQNRPGSVGQIAPGDSDVGSTPTSTQKHRTGAAAPVRSEALKERVLFVDVAACVVSRDGTGLVLKVFKIRDEVDYSGCPAQRGGEK